MSHWSQVETKIQDLNTFLAVCKEKGLSIQRHNESYILTLADGSSHAQLTCSGDHYTLSYDRDPNYSNFAKTFGLNGGTLVRDYAATVAKNQAISMGMNVMSSEIRQDGSIRLIIAA